MRIFKQLFYKIRYNILRPIRNFIAWYPIIRDDWNFDYNGIYKILEFKFKRQAKYFIKYGKAVGNDFAAERMLLCARMCSDIRTEHYLDEFYNYFHSDFHVKNSSPNKIEWEETIIFDNFDAYFKKYAHAYREVTKTDKYIFENNSKKNIAWNMSMYLHNKAVRVFFAVFEHNIHKFSD
jgi:hypothetical protein